MLLVKVGVGTCKQLQMLDCCALLSPLKSAGWPLLMGMLDVLTGLVLEMAFFVVEIGFNEVLAFLLLVVTFLVLVDLTLVLGFFVDDTFLLLVVFFVDTATFPRCSKSRLPTPALDSAALDVTLPNPADGAVLPALVDVVFEKEATSVEAVVLLEGLEDGLMEVY